jgi:TPR repeat protein
MALSRLSALAALAAALAACASSIPKAELDRCNLGVADGNDAYRASQGAACGLVAHHLADDEHPKDARAYARKACQLEDSIGCTEYLALVRAESTIAPDELLDARTAGEQACAGMVVAASGADARPALCARTAELYLDVEPKSTSDAARLYLRACKLGDENSCAHARSLGVDPDPPRPSSAKTAPPAPRPPSPPPAATAPPAPLAPACHEMRACVSLDLVQRSANEVVGTLTNHCDGAVTCAVCPSNGDQIDKAACHTVSLAPSEWRSGRESGLAYHGYSAMAYDCFAAGDDHSCLGL